MTDPLQQARDALAEFMDDYASEDGMQSMKRYAKTFFEAMAALDAFIAARGEPVAWGVFAKIEDGNWHLQHPVRFTEEDAKADRAMYERTTMLDVRPLYTAPPSAAQHGEPVAYAAHSGDIKTAGLYNTLPEAKLSATHWGDMVVVPLCAAPPVQRPLTPAEIDAAARAPAIVQMSHTNAELFAAGVKFAERHYGITGA